MIIAHQLIKYDNYNPKHRLFINMQIHLLGTGAGGGFPQWNCNCSNCSRLRAGTIKSSPRTQS